MMTDWGHAPFMDYLNAVDALLERQYGCTCERRRKHIWKWSV